jgi:DNA-binding NarL/FixJ family response regulator
MEKTRILLADDHTIVRRGIRSLLESHPDFTVIGEVSDGLEAVEMIENEAPDVVLMDITMPNLNGLDATRQVMQGKTNTKIVILSMHANTVYAVRALKNGAVGYILKNADEQEIFHVIETVMEGQRYITPQLSSKILDALLLPDSSGDSFNELTVRERQVLQMVAEGNTNNEIAKKIALSVRTVEVHRSKLMAKLKIDNQAELVRYAIQKGLVPLEGSI